MHHTRYCDRCGQLFFVSIHDHTPFGRGWAQTLCPHCDWCMPHEGPRSPDFDGKILG